MTTKLSCVLPEDKTFSYLYLNLWRLTFNWANRTNQKNWKARSKEERQTPIASPRWQPQAAASMQLSGTPIFNGHNKHSDDHMQYDYVVDFLTLSWERIVAAKPMLANLDTWTNKESAHRRDRAYLYQAFLNYHRSRARNERRKTARLDYYGEIPEELHPMISDNTKRIENTFKAVDIMRTKSTPQELVILDWQIKNISEEDACERLECSRATLYRMKNAAYKRWTTFLS